MISRFSLMSVALLFLGTTASAAEPERPAENAPQPYRTVRTWGELPTVQGIVWPAAVTAVEPDHRGHVYVVYRCFGNSCAGRDENPILKFDMSGKLLAQWGAGMFVFPHGATVDGDGNLWLADARGADGIGHQVFKFSPDGEVLMTLGKVGVAGSGPDTFNQPTDVAIAPNGDIYVADGHRNSQAPFEGNNRIVRFNREGRYLGEFGRTGTGAGEFREPHSILFDSSGRLFVADRMNNRIQIFDKDGKYLDEWTQFGRPSGLAIDAEDTLYVADSESGPDTGANENYQWRKGIRIGSALTGEVTAFIQDLEPVNAIHSGAEGVGVDDEGNVYGAVVRRQMLEKHIPVAKSVAPRFEVDPLWPKPLPKQWVLGQTVGVSVDDRDHVWIIHRPNSLEPNELHATTNPPIASCCVPAPPVLEFDPAGNLVNAWGGPGEGYDWPDSNHGITVDYKGNVWIGSNGRPANSTTGADDAGSLGAFHDTMVLKFSPTGEFLLQIGKPGQSRGSSDPDNLRMPAKVFVDAKTNEAYVADGYGNHRVIVFDADTGRFKRHWGAYGNTPSDEDLGPYVANQAPAAQFRNPVHCAMVSNDDLVYVCDRANDRIQVFRTDGSFVREAFFETQTMGSGSVWDLAFSADPGQRFIYITDGENRKVRIVERESLEVLTSFGDGGQQPGQFYGVHNIATDSKGNIYTTETYRGQRVQKFVYRGLEPVKVVDQGVVWPQSQ